MKVGGAAEAVGMEMGQASPRADRLLMMAIEIDHAAPAVWDAVDALAETDLPTFVGIIEAAPHESALAREAWKRCMSAERLRAAIDADPPDLETLERVFARLGTTEAGTLLDLLCESDSLATRKRIFTRLTELGPRIADEVARRTRDERWFARRNMLAVMGEIDPWPRKWNPAEFAGDPHPAVRREAFKLMLRSPGHRDRALCGLLEDTDRRARSLGLAAATESCPPEAIHLLTNIAEDESNPTDQRGMAIRGLGRSGDPVALSSLLGLARRGSGLAPNRLGPKGPIVLAALQALATFEGDASAAKKLLVKAARSHDPDILAALGKEPR